MRVFLTGATGYVGQVVAEHLQAAGHSVIGLARTDAAASALHDRQITPHQGDLRDPQSLTQAATAADGVIHTAFIHDFSDFAGAVAIERQVIAALTEALSGSNKPLIATSGTGLLGDTGDRIVDETAIAVPSFILAVRAAAEQDVVQAAKQGIRSSIVRLPLYVYGHGGSAFIPLQINAAKAAGVARYIEAGDNQASAVHVEDAAQVYRLALEAAPAGSIFNVATQSGITGKAIAQAIGTALNCPTESISFAQAEAQFGTVLATFLSMNNQVSAAKAIAQLGWQPSDNLSLLNDIQHGSYRPVMAVGEAQ